MKVHIEESSYAQDPIFARKMEWGNGKCDGHECDHLVESSNLFEGNEWISIHAV